jgi:hypothetical protein
LLVTAKILSDAITKNNKEQGFVGTTLWTIGLGTLMHKYIYVSIRVQGETAMERDAGTR